MSLRKYGAVAYSLRQTNESVVLTVVVEFAEVIVSLAHAHLRDTVWFQIPPVHPLCFLSVYHDKKILDDIAHTVIGATKRAVKA